MDRTPFRVRLGELSSRPRVALVIWWSVVVLLSLLHLFINAKEIGHPELWLDESSTFGVARRSFTTVLTLPTQFHSQPPLYYVLLHFLMKVYDARWFLRGFCWLNCLFLVLFVLFWLDELKLSSRVLFCILFITANLNHYLSTALRPYGMAVFTSFASTVFLLRLLREPTRRAATLYAMFALVMLYTMAFDVCVVAAHGVFVGAFLAGKLARLGRKELLRAYGDVVRAMSAVVIGYLPYLFMAAHWHYKDNAKNELAEIWTVRHYLDTANEHFGYGTAAMWILLGLVLLGLWGEARDRRWLSFLWIVIALWQVAFVVYFMTGRGVGPQGRYMTPALPSLCLLAALGWDHLVSNVSRLAWQLLPLFLTLFAWPACVAYVAYMKTPRPLGVNGQLRKHMKEREGNKLVFYDIGYSGQDLQYVIRHDTDIETATMAGEGPTTGGDSHLDAGYIRQTIERTHRDTRCYYYLVERPDEVYATVFVPEMKRLGYVELAPIGRVREFCDWW